MDTMNFLDRFRIFMGPERFRWLLILLGITGALSFVLTFVDATWSVLAQTVLALAALGSAVILIGGRMNNQQRLRALSIMIPAFGLVLLGVFFLPEYQAALFGGAFGWMVVGLFLFRNNRAPQQYQNAIKAMRKSKYDEAVAAMDELVKEEPENPNHYHFRAQLLRMWGKTGRARRDYQTMIEKADNDAAKAVGYNGVAEVELQAGNYETAREAAQQAYQLAPGEWVVPYNLGLIEDRLHHNQKALDVLADALDIGIPDSRHRLLAHFYMARAYARLGDDSAAVGTVELMKKERGGLIEWKKIMSDEQAAVLREVLQRDIALAEKLVKGEIDVAQLVNDDNMT